MSKMEKPKDLKRLAKDELLELIMKSVNETSKALFDQIIAKARKLQNNGVKIEKIIIRGPVEYEEGKLTQTVSFIRKKPSLWQRLQRMRGRWIK